MQLLLLTMMLALLPSLATAQAWFTREACSVTEPRIDPAILPPDELTRLQIETAEIPNATGRLWKITSPSGMVSHLWGTFHSNAPIFLDLPKELRALLGKVRVIAPESDGRIPSREVYNIVMRGEHFYDGLGTLRSAEAEPRALRWASHRLNVMGFASGVDYFSLAGVAMLLMSHPCNDFAEGVYPIQDHRIQLLAEEAGARVEGLEQWNAISQKLSAPENLPIAIAMIEAYSAGMQEHDVASNEHTWAALYLSGQIGLMMALEHSGLINTYGRARAAEIRNLMDGYLLTERNQDFMKRAIPLAQDGGVFFAVGAFHLPGEQGMVALFREAGYTVERISVGDEVPG